MTNYRRHRATGGTYFFTVILADRSKSLLTDNIDSLRDAFRNVAARHPFVINAVVVLPDHLHAIWTLPENDCDYSMRWRLIKTRFSRAMKAGEAISPSRERKGERGIWQRRYWEHTIADERDYERHVSYIHFNPVKHGFVSRVGDWPHSSFHRFVKAGILPNNWAGNCDVDTLDFGERIV